MPSTSLRISILTLVLCFAAVSLFAQELDIHKCWQQDIADGRSLATDGSSLFVAGGGGRIDAYSREGKKAWSADLGGEVSSNLIVSAGKVMAVTTGGGASTVRSLARETGVTAWTLKLPESSQQSLASVHESLILVSADGVIQALAPADGAVRWKREIASGFAGDAVFSGDRILVASTAKQLFVVSAINGEIEAMQKQQFQSTAFTFLNNSLVIGDERGNLTSTPMGGAKPAWRFKTGGRVSLINTINGQLLIGSYDNFVYIVNPENGSVRWKRRLTARLTGFSLFGPGYLATAATDDHSAALTSIETGKTAGQIAFGTDEVLAGNPAPVGPQIVVLTSGGLKAFSTGPCKKQESGPGL